LTEVVLPSRDDPVLGPASEGVGGRAGVRVRDRGVARALVAVLLMTTVVCLGGLIQKQPCRASAWTNADMYPKLCYSDIAFLYRGRAGLADGGSPYAVTDDQEPLEYPVLTGGMMALAARVANAVDSSADEVGRSRTFFDVTAIMLAGLALATTWLVARTAGRRPWDAALFALAPGLLLTAYINWDLLAVALTAGSMLAFARRRPLLAGLLLGLAIAAKFYPVVLLGPMLLLMVRTGRWAALGRYAGGAAVAWLAVNVPVRAAWPDGWSAFYTLSADRPAGYGSIWYALSRSGHAIADDLLNKVALGSFAVLCLGIAALALFAPRRPRVGQLAFLVVAAFAMTNKVYSPQYVLWMLALFPLARPRWRDLLIWQAAEVTYFVAVWWHLQGLTDPGVYVVPEWTHNGATLLRLAATLWVCGVIVRDILVPARDPVRADGVDDDPAGGVLDGAPDRLPWLQPRPPAPVEAPGRHATA
jgi:uncharacterized membrane protein